MVHSLNTMPADQASIEPRIHSKWCEMSGRKKITYVKFQKVVDPRDLAVLQCWTAKLNKKILMMYFCLKHLENMFLIFAKKNSWPPLNLELQLNPS